MFSPRAPQNQAKPELLPDKLYTFQGTYFLPALLIFSYFLAWTNLGQDSALFKAEFKVLDAVGRNPMMTVSADALCAWLLIAMPHH